LRFQEKERNFHFSFCFSVFYREEPRHSPPGSAELSHHGTILFCAALASAFPALVPTVFSEPEPAKVHQGLIRCEESTKAPFTTPGPSPPPTLFTPSSVDSRLFYLTGLLSVVLPRSKKKPKRSDFDDPFPPLRTSFLCDTYPNIVFRFFAHRQTLPFTHTLHEWIAGFRSHTRPPVQSPRLLFCMTPLLIT